jgi:hypothetical protein
MDVSPAGGALVKLPPIKPSPVKPSLSDREFNQTQNLILESTALPHFQN